MLLTLKETSQNCRQAGDGRFGLHAGPPRERIAWLDETLDAVTAASVAPGQAVILWGTGLGAIAAPDDQAIEIFGDNVTKRVFERFARLDQAIAVVAAVV